MPKVARNYSELPSEVDEWGSLRIAEAALPPEGTFLNILPVNKAGVVCVLSEADLAGATWSTTNAGVAVARWQAHQTDTSTLARLATLPIHPKAGT